jgi:hypothetical protein
MTVAELFAKEHALFRLLLERLALDLAQPEDRARRDVSDALRVLVPSLDRHAEIEDIVFRHPPDGTADPSRALAEVEEQHRQLSALRDEVLCALERSAEECPFGRLRTLTQSLMSDLRVHLETEETRLWPLYRGALQRPLDAVVPIHLEKRALALEKELHWGIAAISHAAPAGTEKS